MKGTRSQAGTDWTNMSWSNWMDMTPSDWMDRMPLGWSGRSYGDLLRTKPSDWLTMVYGQGTTPGMGPTSTAAGQTRPFRFFYQREEEEEWRGEHRHERRHEHRHEEGCRHCGREDCECFCCLGDVDLAIYARVGEERVIPIVIENERRRDKDITLELSEWRTRGGRVAPVDTVLLEPKTFSLPSCAEQKVTLTVRTKSPEQTANQQGGENQERKVPTDVDDCFVATADLRLVGCDHRPLRIAIAILPRDCDAYWVECGCTCC